mmetsp:Transcript_18821/g.48328  ORF Transcript_18821/g.48328 Transcript_18821/m.48328 type:complete len:237 (-) Transcript_18821:408-1118(-)
MVSHLSCEDTKTRIFPFSYHSPRISSSRRKRSASGRISTNCAMSLLTTLRPPTCTSTGSCSTDRARISTDLGKVAEKSTVCRSGRMPCTMRVICGSNPMSNMRSASSSTRYVTRRRLQILPLLVARMSIMRPGVQTTTSAPRLSSLIWLATPLPPKTLTTVSSAALAKRLTSLPICCTSSRVGAITIATGPSFWPSGGWSLMCLSMGSTKASVLPEPVLAMPIQSRPDMMTGSACA